MITNLAAFDMSTPESLYWLGFLYADGCVHATELILCLSEKDAGHVAKFKAFLGSNNRISEVQLPVSAIRGKEIKCRTASRIAIGIGSMAEELKQLGITTGQRSVTHPSLISSRDFWRGVIDGDGHVRVQRYQYLNASKPIIGLCGSHDTIFRFIEWARTVCPRIRAVPARDKSIWQCIFAADIGAQLIRALYIESSVALDRKKATADAITASWIPQRDRGVLVRLANGRYAAA